MSFTQAEVVGLFAFLIDLGLGPLSALILLGALVFSNSGRAWGIFIGVTAGLNLLVASTILLTVADGLSWVVWIVVVQAVVSAAVLAIATRRPWRAVVFGRRAAKS